MDRLRPRRGKRRLVGTEATAAAAGQAMVVLGLAVLALAVTAPTSACAATATADQEQVTPAGPALRESAFSRLWAEQADQAIADFQSYFQTIPAADDRPGRLGLALAYSWAGRQDDAVRVYRELLDRDPADADARFGLGRSLIWDNELRQGFHELREVVARHPASDAARESRRFMLTVLDDYTPVLQGRWEASWDSDDLDITRFGADVCFAGPGPLLLELQPQITRYDRPDLDPITGRRLGAGAAGTLRRNLLVQAHGWVDFFSQPGFLGGDTYWTRAGTDSWLTWLPIARVRLDAGATSQPVESFAALAGKIGFTQGHLSGDWRAGRRWTLSLAGKGAHYSDGNDRRQASARLSWRRDGKVQVWIGPAATYLKFREDSAGAYWSPARVRNLSLETTLKTCTGRMTFKVSGSLGLEKDGNAESVTVGGGSLRIGWQAGAGWLLAAEAGHARSALSTASGYRRTFTGLSVRAVF